MVTKKEVLLLRTLLFYTFFFGNSDPIGVNGFQGFGLGGDASYGLIALLGLGTLSGAAIAVFGTLFLLANRQCNTLLAMLLSWDGSFHYGRD